MGNGIKSKWHPRKLYSVFSFLCFFENPPLETNDYTNKYIYFYNQKGDYSNKSTLSKGQQKEVQNNGIKINSERGSILMILILLKLAVLMVLKGGVRDEATTATSENVVIV